MSTEQSSPFDFSPPGSISPLRLSAQSEIGKQARRGAITLFVVAGLQAVFMVFFTIALIATLVRLRQWEPHVADPAQLRLPMLIYVSYGSGLLLLMVFLGLGFWTRRDPLLASIMGFTIFLAANVFDLVLAFGFGLGFTFGSGIGLMCGGWFVRCFIGLLLLDAIRASLAYRRIVNKLILEEGVKAPHD
jgi:hypothetical protein